MVIVINKLLPWFLSCRCDNHHDQKPLGEEQVCVSLLLTLLHEVRSGQELREGTSRRELKQRPWRSAAYWPHLRGGSAWYLYNPSSPAHSAAAAGWAWAWAWASHRNH